MDPSGFLADIEQVPHQLRLLAHAFETTDPWAAARDRSQFLLTGMGSSAYAARTAAGWLRSAQLSVVEEIASLEPGLPGGDDTTAILISATGGSVETLDRRKRLHRDARTVALTNQPHSALAAACDVVVDLAADTETSGVACRTYRHTLALLLALGRPVLEMAQRCREAAELSNALLFDRVWLDRVAEMLGDGATYWVAPANRIGTAMQAALMIREVPRRAAVGCETGDWSHVDVYLTATTDYRAVFFTGSAWDAQAAEWLTKRGSTVVSVGVAPLGVPGELHIPLVAEPLTAMLVEPIFAELLGQQWWRQNPPVVN